MSSGDKAGKPIQSRNYRSRAGVFGVSILGVTGSAVVETLPVSILSIHNKSYRGILAAVVSFFS